MSQDGWTVKEAMGMALAWGILNEVDSLEAHVEGDALIVNASKVIMSEPRFILADVQVGTAVEIKPS